MFTGIIQNMGILKRHSSARISVESNMNLSDVHAGDSIAVNGVCLTTLNNKSLEFDLNPETLKKTTLGELEAGTQVHLEKALRLSDRLGGHFVQGHIDNIGRVLSLTQQDTSLVLKISAPKEILALCIPKGSIAIDGVSLTINQVSKEDFEVCLIPHTLEKTHFKALKSGNLVNLEVDMIAKSVAHIYNSMRST